MNLGQNLNFSGLMLALSMISNTYAADITWGAPNNVFSSSDVSTNGTLVEAFNLGSTTNNQAVTVNGSEFIAKSDFLFSNSTIDVYSDDTGDEAYNTLLSTLDLGGGTNTVTVSIGDGQLSPGLNYEIQVWYADTRLSRTVPVGDGNGNSVDLLSTGQYAVGTFTADGSSQTLTLESPGFGNAHLNAYQLRNVSLFPVAVLSTDDTYVNGEFTVNIEFTENITGLTESDFTVSNGSVVNGSLSGANNSYTIDILPDSTDKVTITLLANTILNSSNESNALDATMEFLLPSPGNAVTLLTSHDLVYAPFDVTAHFDDVMTGLELNDFIVTNGTLSNLEDHADGNFHVTVTPTSEGIVTLTLPEGSSISLSNSTLNYVSNTLEIDYTLSPTAVISGDKNSVEKEFDVFVSFTPYISGFTASDIEVANGSVIAIEMQGRRDFADRFYKVTVEAEVPGEVVVFIPAGGVNNLESSSHTNTDSNALTVIVSDDFGESWVVDSDAEWAAQTSASSNMSIANGLAEPTANSATFSSATYSFPVAKKATQVTFTQSNAWANWTAVANVGPTGAGNAPIFLSIGNDDYYYFGQKGTAATKSYHAWHSTDMVNWTQLDQFSHNTYNWCTSAEYKDGTFYLLNDTPNDHTPHLFTDDNLNDGVVGTFHGMVFNDPTGGGDSVLFRDDADDLFHIISEDWSPVWANAHSYDSPLATHASSTDCINGFVPAEHLPPIDERTTPTGTYKTFNHPHIEGTHISNPITYEVHEGEQKALGDWAAIKVGERYYLFGDYEHDTGDKFINTGWLCSDSLYDQFELVGNIGDGHPDPDIGFAEGQFYLITQASTDFVSPGPWVDGVEARAGVDTDNNGTIDQWTSWQGIAESYDHTPGYAKIVTTTPAALDLSSLPTGYGFKFEFRIDDTVVSTATPVIDKVEMKFSPSNFQQWANTQSIPASADNDENKNGIADAFDFALASPFQPQLAENGNLQVVIKEDALEDGMSLVLEYSETLQDWEISDAGTDTVKLTNSVYNDDNNYELTFTINPNSTKKLFVRAVILMP